jgi:hypothetical protein
LYEVQRIHTGSFAISSNYQGSVCCDVLHAFSIAARAPAAMQTIVKESQTCFA